MAKGKEIQVVIETVPHDQHRYETTGDWFCNEKGELIIRVSQLNDWRHEVLLAVHELVEAVVCMHEGIDEHDVTEFDLAFEANRKEGDIREPGDQADAPYFEAHQIATMLEGQLAIALGVDWKTYEEGVLDAG